MSSRRRTPPSGRRPDRRAAARAAWTLAAGALVMTGLAGCGKDPVGAAVAPARETADAAYWAAPAVTSVAADGPLVRLAGHAQPGATVRLATPQGQAAEAMARADGTWRLAVPALGHDGLYALSERSGGRVSQSEGYLLVTARGEGVLLRAGAGAVRLRARNSGIAAFDFDRAGGAVVSGRGQPGGVISARLDGKKVGEGRVDSQGRFAIALAEGLRPGAHSLKVFGDSLDAGLNVDTSPAAPLTGGPIRTEDAQAGLRIDWMTPGGGVQTTFLPS